MNRTLRFAVIALTFATLALAQAQQRSVRSELTQLGVLSTWKVSTPTTPIPDLKLERTQMYEIGLKTGEGQAQTLSLLLGANATNPFTHYAAIIYNGAATRAAGVAHGYLTNIVARDCIGLDEPGLEQVRGLMSAVISALKNVRVARRLRDGPLMAEASAEYAWNRLSVVMILERDDAPGKGWGRYCGFEK